MFKFYMTGLQDKKKFQVSMDGLNVTKRLLAMLKEERQTMIQVCSSKFGTYDLHTINRSLQTGNKSKVWNLKKLLSSMYQTFHKNPSGTSHYERMSQATKSDFPYMFCATRWVENQSVARKTRQLWSKVVIVAEYCKSLPKRKQPTGG